ncbi:thioredoxin domain-containing protein [Paenibacillus xylanilyticus]|uniref:Thioredoxin family protein n=1 Tax=Paenibacillus xylanilyticus TaxID=248903 RepID=A0A7Y6BTS1_9BACL|nr:thioredoxin family protein [Paenibacillus xylanilyticus]NUU74699.1 thioredoxin family protein [Paenibacillus xylanilyticus]
MPRKKSFLKLYLPMVVLGIVIVFCAGMLFRPNEDMIQNIAPDEAHEQSKERISVVKADVYDKQQDSDYLVYFYSDECHVCNSYKPTLEKYRSNEDALNVYGVDVLDPDAKTILKDLNINETPTLIRITRGIESWRALGDLPISLLPIHPEKI